MKSFWSRLLAVKNKDVVVFIGDIMELLLGSEGLTDIYLTLSCV